MIRRLAVVAAWLAACGGVCTGLFWAYVNTPEADVLRLTLSAFLALSILVLSAVAVNVAVLLALDESLRACARTALRRLPWFLVAATPVALAVWLIGRFDAWMELHEGEIRAWFVVTFDWTTATTWLFRIEHLASVWLRWVVVPTLSLGLLTALMCRPHISPTRRSVLRGCRWRPLLVVSGAFALFIALPWQSAFTEPFALPPNWLQPTVAGLRLLLVGAAMAIGAAVMVVATARAVGAAGVAPTAVDSSAPGTGGEP